MRKKLFILILFTFRFSLFAFHVHAQSMDLSGTWQFKIDRYDVGKKEGWYKPEFKFDDTIQLPGSMPEHMKGDDPSMNTPWVGAIYDSSFYFNPYMEKYRVEGNVKFPFFLTPTKHYVGKAWYKKTFTLSDPSLPLGNMEGTRADYLLYLERPHITSTVWVNGEYAGQSNSLSVSHNFNISKFLKRGENTIVICVNNDPDEVKVGNDSHSVTDQTQGCWNGIVGKIELRPYNRILSVNVYPDVDNHKAKVRLLLDTHKGVTEKATVKLTAEAFNTNRKHVVETKANDPKLTVNISGVEYTPMDVELDMGEDMLLWDEFNPQLYRLTVEVKTKNGTDTRETVFGMRKIEIRDKMFYVNGREIMLRGNVENCLFPNTGYPPTDLDSWINIYKRCKEFGLNHIRFHSYCPPEAAFLAADMVGFYIQPEGPSWPNHGVRLGRGEFIDNYLYKEAMSICDEYGNHPSFTFFAFGNEPAGNWVKWCNEHVPLIKEYDPRHIYPGFSVGGGWAWQPEAEFAVKAGARGLAEWTKSAPESMADFSDKINMYMGKDMPNTPITVPFVTHEMGQWCAFPNFSEISKYTGVNKAKNFEIFRDLLRDNGMECRERDFLMASGKLQALCYKYETERILRTPKYAGFQILSINDYSGQGSALVGVTDVFYGDKGYCTAEDFREFCSPVVPLAKFPKFTYSNADTFEADLLVSQYSNSTLKNVNVHWEVRLEQAAIMLEEDKTPIAQGNIALEELPCGQQSLGHISVNLSDITVDGKYKLEVSISDDNNAAIKGNNHWNFWVYPEICDGTEKDRRPKVKQGKRPGTMFFEDMYITDSLDAQALKHLQKGGKVLICAAGKTTYGKEVVQQFLPVFWNTSWFKMRPPHTTGLFIEKDHPVFTCFPTDYHSDLQWWELVNKARVMQFTDFPKDFQPLVQSIDTWFVSRKIGMLFEANVKIGKSKKTGRLMMTTMDITNDLDHRLVARQMRESIIGYMQQDDKFQPQHTIDIERIQDLFTKVAGEVNMFTNESPDELKPALK